MEFPVVSGKLNFGIPGSFREIPLSISRRFWYGAPGAFVTYRISAGFTLPQLVRTCYVFAHSAFLGSVLCHTWYEHGPISVLTTVVFASLTPSTRSATNLWAFDTVNLQYVLAELGTSFAPTLWAFECRNVAMRACVLYLLRASVSTTSRVWFSDVALDLKYRPENATLQPSTRIQMNCERTTRASANQ